MGKNTISNQKKKLAKALKKKARLNLEALTIPELLARAQEEIDIYQYENAQRFCQEALKRDPDNVSTLETSASLCLEVGNLDGAKHCLGRAITLQPEEGYSKYLSMAQLMDGKESLQCYLKGIELIQASLNNLQQTPASENTTCKSDAAGDNTNEVEMTTTSNTEGESKEISEDRENEPPTSSSNSVSSSDNQSLRSTLIRQMSTAYCSIAELFMTDLCDEEDAENQCHSNISRAVEADPSNPEAYQNMASFLLVKQEMEQAKECIKKSIDLWLPKYKAIAKGEAEAGSFDPVEVCPLSYPTRLSTAKILIEVEDYENAVDVLEGLAEEDDTVVDTWYLLGWSSYLRGEEHKDNARYFLHKAMQVHKSEPSSDEQLISHLEELLTELGPLPDDEEDDDDDDDANIEDELEDSGEEDEDQEMDTN